MLATTLRASNVCDEESFSSPKECRKAGPLATEEINITGIGNRINPIAHKMTQHRVPVLCCFIYDCFLSIPYICSPHQFLL